MTSPDFPEYGSRRRGKESPSASVIAGRESKIGTQIETLVNGNMD